MWTKIGYRSTSAINRKAIYIHKGSKKTKKYIMYKGIRNAITKERHRHRNSHNLYTFLYLGTMDINNMVLN